MHASASTDTDVCSPQQHVHKNLLKSYLSEVKWNSNDFVPWRNNMFTQIKNKKNMLVKLESTQNFLNGLSWRNRENIKST